MKKTILEKQPKAKTSAFTLAEVLITLGIIGVLAAITIPTLIQNANEKATVTAIKKAYSTLSNAYTLAVQENGTPDNWGMTVGSFPQILSNLAPYLKVTKDCTDNSQGCFPTGGMYKYLSLADHIVLDNYWSPKLKLTDGTMLLGNIDSITCGTQHGNSLALQNICAHIYIDTNGYKGPNQDGKDLFNFYLTKYGIVPYGTAQATSYSFAGGCKDKSTATGQGCTAWVIYNENMDYLHCNYLDWSGKTQCD